MVFNSAQVQLSLSFVVQESHLLDNGSLGNGPETKEITFLFLKKSYFCFWRNNISVLVFFWFPPPDWGSNIGCCFRESKPVSHHWGGNVWGGHHWELS